MRSLAFLRSACISSLLRQRTLATIRSRRLLHGLLMRHRNMLSGKEAGRGLKASVNSWELANEVLALDKVINLEICATNHFSAFLVKAWV